MSAPETDDGPWWPIPAPEVAADGVPYRQRLEATIEAAEAELKRLDEQEAIEERLNGDPTRHVITSTASGQASPSSPNAVR